MDFRIRSFIRFIENEVKQHNEKAKTRSDSFIEVQKHVEEYLQKWPELQRENMAQMIVFQVASPTYYQAKLAGDRIGGRARNAFLMQYDLKHMWSYEIHDVMEKAKLIQQKESDEAFELALPMAAAKNATDFIFKLFKDEFGLD